MKFFYRLIIIAVMVIVTSQVQAQTRNVPIKGFEADSIEWYSGKNNYRMPAYIRMDFGCAVSWEKNRHPMSLNAGVYNLLNRHNPVSLVYDAEEVCWKQIYIFPLFPSVRFTAEF